MWSLRVHCFYFYCSIAHLRGVDHWIADPPYRTTAATETPTRRLPNPPDLILEGLTIRVDIGSTTALSKCPTSISTTHIRQSYKKKKQMQKFSESVKNQSKKAQKISESVKKQSKIMQKTSDINFTVIIKSRKSSQITQGRVRKEDGQVICYAKWSEGRESAKNLPNHKQNVLFIQKSDSTISKQKISVRLDSVRNGNRVRTRARVRARTRVRNRTKNIARTYTHAHYKKRHLIKNAKSRSNYTYYASACNQIMKLSLIHI